MPPFHVDGQGIDVELGRAIAAAMGLKFSPMPFQAGEDMGDDLRNMVWKGHYLGWGPADVLLHVPVERALMQANPQVTVIAPYYRERVVLALRTDQLGKVENLAELQGHPVAVAGQSMAGWLLAGAIKEGLITAFADGVGAAQALRDGQVHAAAGLASEFEACSPAMPAFPCSHCRRRACRRPAGPSAARCARAPTSWRLRSSRPCSLSKPTVGSQRYLPNAASTGIFEAGRGPPLEGWPAFTHRTGDTPMMYPPFARHRWPWMALVLPALAQAQNQPEPAPQSVVVTGTRLEEQPFDVPASVDRIGVDQIREHRLQASIAEALGGVPGLMARDRQNYAQDVQISVRGFGARASFGIRGVRMYVDGIPATLPDGQGQVSHVDLSSAERIEILRGPFSALAATRRAA
jgi:hypothetical protein